MRTARSTVAGSVRPLNHTLAATLVQGDNPGAWTCVVTDWTPTFFVTRSLVKVSGTSTATNSDRRSWCSATAPTNSRSRRRSKPASANMRATRWPSISPNGTPLNAISVVVLSGLAEVSVDIIDDNRDHRRRHPAVAATPARTGATLDATTSHPNGSVGHVRHSIVDVSMRRAGDPTVTRSCMSSRRLTPICDACGERGQHDGSRLVAGSNRHDV